MSEIQPAEESRPPRELEYDAAAARAKLRTLSFSERIDLTIRFVLAVAVSIGCYFIVEPFLTAIVIAAILAGFFLIALIRVFSAPLRLALKLLVNTLLGFLALWAVGLTSGLTGITLGLNLWNALVIGVLGLPGFVLLLLVQWVL